MARVGGALRLKRVYETPEKSDGLRILVDRLWPRGIAKEKAHIDLWLKDVAPSNDLRRRFHGKPEAWKEFTAAYAEELAHEPALSLANSIIGKLAGTAVTLLYAARDTEHNNAVALRDWLLLRGHNT